MMGVSGAELFIGVAIVVGGGILLYVLRRVAQYVIDAVAAALVKSINGQLGLDAIRKDVTAMKSQVETVSSMRTQIETLEDRLESILTDL